jgi:hypothetical protein
MNKHLLNEVGRIVADLSDLVRANPEAMSYPFGRESRIFIAGDSLTNGDVEWTLIGPVEWQYRLMDDLCHKRAVDAEFGRLVVNGQRLPAEKYLALWRRECAKPMPLLQLVEFGITPVLELRLPTDHCRSAEHTDVADAWYASPCLVDYDKHTSRWTIPLESVEHFKLAGQLRSIYWAQERNVEGFARTTTLRVADRARILPRTNDLFKEAA